jgi:hypothetical protein
MPAKQSRAVHSQGNSTLGFVPHCPPLPLNRTKCRAPRLGNYLLLKVRGGLRGRVAFIVVVRNLLRRDVEMSRTGQIEKCPHCGKPLAKTARDLTPKDLGLLRLIVSMRVPEMMTDLLTSTLGCSPEGSFDRRFARLRKLGLIDRRKGRVWATEAGRALVGAQQAVADATPENQATRRH